MQNLRVLSLLMDYPTEDLVAARGELNAVIDSMDLQAVSRRGLIDFVEQRCGGNLLDWQSEYDGLFERGRSLSLLLFEHVHGESRDRGQAMVNLLSEYKTAGLELSAKELPDYIPLYLEFLSTQGEANARLGLQEIAHILGLLCCRLQERNNNYTAIFSALLELSTAAIDLKDIQQQLKGEARDDTPAALDKVWEEEAVTFGAESTGDSCATGVNRPLPGQRRDQEQVLDLSDVAREIVRETLANTEREVPDQMDPPIAVVNANH